MRKPFFLGIIFFGIFLDMSSKYLAELYLKNPIFMIPDWIELKLAYNSGIAFSLPIE